MKRSRRLQAAGRPLSAACSSGLLNAARKFLPQTSAALADPRVSVLIADGVQFMAAKGEDYDAILVDSTDPIGPAQPLFGPKFYANVRRRLSAEGIVVAQGECPFYRLDTQKALLKVIRGAFGAADIYNYHNLTYPGGLWSFAIASKNRRDFVAPDRRRIRALQSQLRYYNLETHKAAFALPQFMKDALVEPG